jgi:hypothetical protein
LKDEHNAHDMWINFKLLRTHGMKELQYEIRLVHELRMISMEYETMHCILGLQVGGIRIKELYSFKLTLQS